jgi:hypothetical protein
MKSPPHRADEIFGPVFNAKNDYPVNAVFGDPADNPGLSGDGPSTPI